MVGFGELEIQKYGDRSCFQYFTGRGKPYFPHPFYVSFIKTVLAIMRELSYLLSK